MSRAFAGQTAASAASESAVHARSADLIELAQKHGITRLAYASPGRLRGHVDNSRDLFDVFEFQRAATELLGAEVALYSEGALANDNVSPDLQDATAL